MTVVQDSLAIPAAGVVLDADAVVAAELKRATWVAWRHVASVLPR